METFVELKGMIFYAYHGVFAQESKVGNSYSVDINYSMPLDNVYISDEISDTISYASVYSLISQEMAIPSKLLESVAARIINRLKTEYPQLSYLKLKLTKMNPPLGGEVNSASVIVLDKW